MVSLGCADAEAVLGSLVGDGWGGQRSVAPIDQPSVDPDGQTFDHRSMIVVAVADGILLAAAERSRLLGIGGYEAPGDQDGRGAGLVSPGSPSDGVT